MAILVLGGRGYIGSALARHLMAKGHDVESVDLLWREPAGGVKRSERHDDIDCPNTVCGYKLIWQFPHRLAKFDTIIMLAGHNGVAACEASPDFATDNNVAGFATLLEKVGDRRVIYASSISTYVRTSGQATEDADLPPAASLYDLHMQTRDRLAALRRPSAIGFRFGTVCGPSPRLREDLVLNAMVKAAMTAGRVELANPKVFRPILGIGDLCRAFDAAIAGALPGGVYNVATTNVAIGNLANAVCSRFGVPAVSIDRPNSYDIRVSTEKIQALGVRFLDTVPDLMRALEGHYRAAS